jgi:copper chaperone CopZ
MKEFIVMKTILRSQELSCPSCVAKIEKSLKALEGVKDAQVFFNTGRIEVEHDSKATDQAELVETVQRVGYQSKVVPF